jgi:ABC-type nitrate/sulfonate/bicarbonate transport system substrate-binding protein
MNLDRYLDSCERAEAYTEAFEAWCEKNGFDPDDDHVQIAYDNMVQQAEQAGIPTYVVRVR